jgi:peptidoglycan/LPS O-acetylase OafA/YrhL
VETRSRWVNRLDELKQRLLLPGAFLGRLHLRRIVTSNHFIPEIDGFRFLAILIVICSHFYLQCGPIPGDGPIARFMVKASFDGARGVFLFFTISGFILALPFARHHLQQGNAVNLRSYFRRRITRLEPPYILAMTLRLGAILWYKSLPSSAVLLHFLATIFYVHNLVYNQPSLINPPAWSLEIEIQFYLLAPLLTTVFLIRNRHLRRGILTAVMLLAAVIALKFIPEYNRATLSLLFYLQYFVAGFLLCDFYLEGGLEFLPSLVWDILGILAVPWILLSQNPWYPVLLPIAALVLYMAGFRGRIVHAIFSFAPISIIGGMCYSLYLTHSTILSAMTPFVHRISSSALPAGLQSLLIFASCFAAVLVAGTIYFVLIERPCMDPAWPHKLHMWFFKRTHLPNK